MAIPRQLPNTITVVRILCAPVFLWLLLADAGADGGARWAAAVLFIVAIGTDGIDGYLARRHNIVTDLGKLLDPIADKVLTGCAFVGLSILGELPWWITIVVLVRELGVTVHRFIVVSDHVVAAAWMGKLKTVAQAVALSLALLPLWVVLGEWIHTVNLVAMTIAVVLTIASGIDYVITAIRAHRGASKETVVSGYPELPDELETTLVSNARETDPKQLVERLRELGWTVATAESLTGGLVSSAIVSVPGASTVFRGGIVAYSIDLKHRLLGVESSLLEAHGAVHSRVARQMADGVRRAAALDDKPVDVGIATTGIAGPDSPDGQPVGTVVIAVSTPLGSRVETLLLDGDRAAIRQDATARALRLALDAL